MILDVEEETRGLAMGAWRRGRFWILCPERGVREFGSRGKEGMYVPGGSFGSLTGCASAGEGFSFPILSLVLGVSKLVSLCA